MQYFDILLLAGSTVIGLLLALVILRRGKFDEAKIIVRADKLIKDAQVNSEELLNRTKEKVIRTKEQFINDQKEFELQAQRLNKVLEIKNSSLLKRENKLTELRQALQKEEAIVGQFQTQTRDLHEKIDVKLIQITGLSRDKAKEELFNNYDRTFKQNAEIRIQRDIEWAQENAVRDGRNVLAETIYRYSAPTSVEHDYAKVIVPHDEMKGRLVGRGGRNIAFFEEFFGVDVIFNDEPNTIIVSCFNLVQREIAKAAIEKLIREKAINEESIARVKPLAEQEVDRILKREGDNAIKILGLKNVPPDFSKLIGRLKFRTSYGQNAMSHCFEVGYFSRLIAGEIGANEEIAWIAGFLHDVGKSVDQEIGGSHDVLTKEILEKYGFSKEIVHAAWTHHNSIPLETIEARIVQAADAISAGRPGARAESVEHYLSKIKDLQETATAFAGVKKAYAINAGRELRVIVDSEKVKDPGVPELAKNIAGKVQEKGGYPGKIKVTTIRVTKTTDYAK